MEKWRNGESEKIEIQKIVIPLISLIPLITLFLQLLPPPDVIL